MADKEAFEAWAGKREKYHTTREWDAMHRAWQTATAAERERCAKVCESLGTTTNGIYERNQECADAIRKVE